MNSRVLESDIAEIVHLVGDDACEFEGRTLLLTGGSGFLGQYFSAVFGYLNEKLLSQPVQLLVLDNLVTGRDPGRTGQAHSRFVQHDVVQPYRHEGPLHYVVHAAGIASPFHYRAYPMQTLEVATNGTRHMLDLAREHDARFLFFSSSEIYGDPDPAHVPTTGILLRIRRRCTA